MKNHAVIVLRDKDKFLFVQRASTKKFLPNLWAFPSGTMEINEKAEETVVREAREELGIDVFVEKLVGDIELPELDSILHLVLCKTNSSENITFDKSEIQKIRWLTFEEFFKEYSDDEIGHGLIYLRKNPEVLQKIFSKD